MGSLLSRTAPVSDFLPDNLLYRFRWVCWSNAPTKDVICSPGITLVSDNVKYEDFGSCYEAAVERCPRDYPCSEEYHLVMDIRQNAEIPFGYGYKFYFVIIPTVIPKKPPSCIPYAEEVGYVYRKPQLPNLKTYPSRQECLQAAVCWWLEAKAHIAENHKVRMIIDRS